MGLMSFAVCNTTTLSRGVVSLYLCGQDATHLHQAESDISITQSSTPHKGERCAHENNDKGQIPLSY